MGDYLGARQTIFNVVKSLGLRLRERGDSEDRRFPEYNTPHTLTYLSLFWSEHSGRSILRYPHAIDAASAFISLIYGLDNAMDDSAPLRLFARDPKVTNQDFLDRSLRAVNLAGYNGHKILGHFISSIALDYPNAHHGRKELLDRCVNFMQEWVTLHRKTRGSERWSFASALAMREHASGQLGVLIGELLSYADARGVHDKAELTVLKMIGMAGQFFDDVCDLVEEAPDVPNDDTHNLYLLIAREEYPQEYEALYGRLKQHKEDGRSIIDAHLVELLSPSTYNTYKERMKTHLEGLAGSNLKLKKIAQWHVREFPFIFRLVKIRPIKFVGNKVKPERASHMRDSHV